MEAFIQFLVDNWQYLSTGLLTLLSLLLFIFRRKSKSWNEFLDALSSCLYWVPTAVISAEESYDFDDEPSKKEKAIDFLLDMIENRLKRELTKKEFSCFYQLMSQQIESVLICPTKKGGLGREDTK